MTKTVLLTLGRLPKALELARAMKRAGYRVIVAEPFAWHVSKPSNSVDKSLTVTAPGDDPQGYLDDMLAIVKAHAVDLIVPVSEESMHVAALHERLPPGVAMFGAPQAELLSLHNKFEFVERARGYGLAVPETFIASSAEAGALARTGPHVVKPIFSCSGKGVKINRSGKPLSAQDAAPGAIVQRFVAGQVYSSFTIADHGHCVVTSVYKGTVISGTVAVAFERVLQAPAVHAWIERFVAAASYTGFIAFDFVEAAGGTIYAIECNPRMTSGVHFIHPGDLARAITDPADARAIRFKDKTQLQQFYPCLTETQASVFKPAARSNNLHYLRTSRDVIWEASDPWPFLLMPVMSYKILALSIFKGLSFGEAATRDIEWTSAHHEAALRAAGDTRRT